MAEHTFNPENEWRCYGLSIPKHQYCRDCGHCDEPSCRLYRSHGVDAVNHPPHYTAGSIECIDAIKAALTPEEFRGFCKGNALAYIWRERFKGKNQDLEKAVVHLNWLKEQNGTDK